MIEPYFQIYANKIESQDKPAELAYSLAASKPSVLIDDPSISDLIVVV